MSKITWSTAESIAFDKYLQSEIGIPAVLLMENASGHLARFAIKLAKAHHFSRILCLVGPGNNGADALVTARHLAQSPLAPSISCFEASCTGRPSFGQLRQQAFNCVQSLRIPEVKPSTLSAEFVRQHFDLVLDGVFGVGLNRPVDDKYFALLNLVQASKVPVLAVDCPSGLDCDTGEARGYCLPATWTLTFVAPKHGFQTPSGANFCGEINTRQIGTHANLAADWIKDRRSTERA